MQGKTQGKGEGEGKKKRCLISSRHIEGIKRITRRGKKMGKAKGGRKMKKPDFYAISFSCKGVFAFVKR